MPGRLYSMQEVCFKRRLLVRLQNSRIFCERRRPSICERKAVWSECARFTSEDRAYGASHLPKTSENDCFAV